MANRRPARPTITNNGPGMPVSAPPIQRPPSRKAHDTLNFQVSVWPTFQPVSLPEAPRDPGKPVFHDGMPTKYRGSTRRKPNIPDPVNEEDQPRKAKVEDVYETMWRKMWDNLQQTGETAADVYQDDPGLYSKAAEDGKMSANNNGRSIVIRMPHAPAPLPPCLQCALAGTCCSLTTKPYAKAFLNDRVSTRPLRPVATRIDPASLVARYGRIVAMMEQRLPDWDRAASGLPSQRQECERKLLQQAILRGVTDSPFLPQPPARCARCERNGEAACLQQSQDMTGTATFDSQKKSSKPVAWFASSGPPPLSLLPQHHVLLPDQIRYDAVDQQHRAIKSELRRVHELPGRRIRSEKQPRSGPRPILEAIFCRNPTTLTASEVASKAQILLEKIEKRHTRAGSQYSQKRRGVGPQSDLATPGYLKGLRTGDDEPPVHALAHVRPATRVEVARLLPRRSWMNVYAGQGVASAAGASTQVRRVHFEDIVRKPVPGTSSHRDTPPALPLWFANDPTAVADIDVPDARRHRWQDHFLNLGEDWVGEQIRRDKQGLRRKGLPLSYWAHRSQEAAQAVAAAAAAAQVRAKTEEERAAHAARAARQERVVQRAASLESKLQEQRKVSARVQAILDAREKRAKEQDGAVADLIDKVGRLGPGQSHQVAVLLAAPIGALYMEGGQVQERYKEPFFF